MNYQELNQVVVFRENGNYMVLDDQDYPGCMIFDENCLFNSKEYLFSWDESMTSYFFIIKRFTNWAQA